MGIRLDWRNGFSPSISGELGAPELTARRETPRAARGLVAASAPVG